MMRLQQAFDWVRAAQPQAKLVGASDTAIVRVHTDTRSLQAGDLFVALRGENFDASSFLAHANSLGAAAAVAPGGLAEAGLAGIETTEPLVALGAVAAGWRAQFDLPLIAVSGSNGKTTVTQMLAAILQAHAGAASLATRGNFNNAIGVPLTLLRLNASHRCAVVELGMNHPGEIAALASMAQPTVALVNNAQREHLEFMHTVEAVAHENGSVLAALPLHGTAVFPADDEHTALWRELAGSRSVMTFGLASGNVRCVSSRWESTAWAVQCTSGHGDIIFSLAMPGEHNVRNALAAVACSLAADIPPDAIAQGLSNFQAVEGRSRVQLLPAAGRMVTLVDDSYNANPDSVRAAIDVLASLPAPRLLVLGDMGEVGQDGPRFHVEAGAYAQARGIEQLCTLGEASSHAATAFAGAQHFASMEELAATVCAALGNAASVLVKGSRFMRMERVVHALVHASEQAPAGAALALASPPHHTIDAGGQPC